MNGGVGGVGNWCRRKEREKPKKDINKELYTATAQRQQAYNVFFFFFDV